ncbi:hypothetical protein Cgig2_003574 [Carnegiea gigantea]|uniref:Uncharacterized protein n=1 Tax=Carnegiea gigantea TaxID=171969 RepID=A0A9Q1JX71_9CARY|nr:hypothetical protein Cgig2_003574 [Carnegiea gigantea]
MRITSTLPLRARRRWDRNCYNPEGKKDNDVNGYMEIITTSLSGGHALLQTPQNNALVIQLKIATAMVHRIFMNTRSSIDIITIECLKKLQYNEKELEAIETSTMGSGTSRVSPWNQKTTYLMGDKDNLQTLETNIVVVRSQWGYNIILGRPTLNAIIVMVAGYLLLIQFELDDKKVGKLYGDQKMARKCYYVSLKSLGWKEEPRTGRMSQPSKVGKTVATKAMVVRSALAEEHGRPHLEFGSEMVLIPLDLKCLQQTIQIHEVKVMMNMKSLTTLRGTMYDVGGIPDRLRKGKPCFFVAH